VRHGAKAALTALVLAALCARPAMAQPAPPAAAEPAPAAAAEAAPAGDLQSPEQRSTRYSAYTLPAGMWGLDGGLFGIAGGDVFAKLGAAYGLGAGVELEVNLAHMSVGLFNLTAGWHFVHARYLDLGASLGAWYGHGDWFWIATDAVQKIAANFDVVSIPVTLTASSQPTRWLELDLGVQYQYANIFGSTGDNVSVFTDAQLAVLQLSFRPGVRFFVSDNTALEAFAKLPAFTTIPRDAGDKKVAFSDAWSTEFGVRSRLARGLFGNMRLHYGQPVGLLYGGAKFYPAFDLELRL